MRRSASARIGIGFAAFAIAAWSFFPIYWMIVSSLRSQQELFTRPTLLPSSFSLESYQQLLEVTDYPQQFRNSIVVALAVVAITLVASIIIAYAVTRFRVPFKLMIVGSMLYAYMFPPMLLAIPLYGIFVSLGIADSLFALVIAHCTLTLPLGVWLLWGFFKSMPFELEEAAMVDGCTRLGSFVRVVLPLSLPGIVTVAIFAFLLSWTDYTYALVMISSDTQKTLPVGLASMVGSFELRWGEVMAGATLIALPLFLMFTLLSRYFIQGLAAGATKG
ncbi:carbohydrate ABC transporter permease [Bosea sp. (in: a-proteobacteria)]|jgi:multiple sugar transport system permease protein|uniref:carbohydrate ABC transporter permease n=1 Tax=Bosea sp. (in: a-proteobacteria) TaxID=1871050 RepID=UPI00086BF511|nr:carbohydrate ABC transporter permease [Bosea sp. (in: a-proteobacteria)]MBN9438034.1 carbohydrate ABC transporter permease [Bosea sp. (in: a-proteobacteria)]ODT55092.1 MAG: ABC transporter permease [Methylobacterium sp. SCN 67-24]